jgi:hypothetical protein
MSSDQNFKQMSQGKRSSLAGEFIAFLKHSRKWWLIPVILVLLGLGLLMLLSSTAAAPFIYPLF